MTKSLFSQDKDIQELLKVSQELFDIAASMAVLEWDQNTYMPPNGGVGRAQQTATLAGIYHERMTNPRVGRLIRNCNSNRKQQNIYDRALVREMAREYEKAVKIPTELVKAISEQQSRSFNSWKIAKERSDFKIFAPDLAKLLELKVKAAKILQKKGQALYDVFLDDFEPGLTEKEVGRVFAVLQPKLTKMSEGLSVLTKNADKAILAKTYDVAKQWSFNKKMMKEMLFDMEGGRIDVSPHPFTIDFGVGDVRITNRERKDDVRSMIFGTIHETGHALHHQGLDLRLDRTTLAGSPGLGMSESQSRLWENIVGRSSEFWQHYFPELQSEFPQQLGNVAIWQFVKAVNVVKPSLIRVEADEVTYGLHIILRFEIERGMVNGKVKIADLPKIWHEKMKFYLGVVPPSDREGVLQDVHWSTGSIGYFPTYLLGTLMAAQIWNTLQKQTPDVKEKIAGGELLPIREWLRENIHRWGGVYQTNDLLKNVTGEPLNPDYFLKYLEDKFSRLYG
jgi:carboxypeptidase Taq